MDPSRAYSGMGESSKKISTLQSGTKMWTASFVGGRKIWAGEKS
jgi:hypothetical protein